MQHRLVGVALGVLAIGSLLPAAAHAQASPSPYTSATRYDAAGRVTGTIAPDPDGAGPMQFLATRTTYDPAGRPIKVEKGELATWKSESPEDAPPYWEAAFTAHTIVETTYNAQNAKLTERVSDANLQAYALTQYSYDGRGRLECTAVRMNPAAYASLPASACTLGAEGSHGPDRITRNVYDAAGQLLQVREGVGTAVEAAEVTYTYTLDGRTRFVIDAGGNKAELRYDGHGRQSRWVFPSATGPAAFDDSTPASAVATAGALNEADHERYEYDPNGNRTLLRKRNGPELEFQYDALNRNTVKLVPEHWSLHATYTRDVHYGYDLRGLMTSARFDGAIGEGVTIAYDGFGRKVSETLAMDGATRTLGSSYDRDGNRTRLTYPDNHYVDYSLHPSGALYLLYLNGNQPLLHPARDALHRPYLQLRWNTAAGTWGPGTSYQYDALSRLAGYNRDLAGTAHDTGAAFAYNPAGQIASATRGNDAYAWTGAVTADRAYTANGLNQYSAVASTAFAYDANGNLTFDGVNSYLYDIENRLVWRNDGATGATMRYDPLGRLYEVYGTATGTTRFLYDGDALVAEYDGAGAMLRRYVHGTGAGDDPLVWFEGPGVANSARRYLWPDERGSIVAVTGGGGGNAQVLAYDEYGLTNASAGDLTTRGRFRYTGQAWIPEFGMYHYKARIYSPTLGRFMQTDPIGYEDAFNLYGYVGNDPVNGVDPSGMQTVPGSYYSELQGVCDGDLACVQEYVRGQGRVAKAIIDFFTADVRAAVRDPTGLNIAIAAAGLTPLGKGYTVAKAGGRFVGRAQRTLRAGEGSGHAHASARAAREMIVTGKYANDTAYLNRSISTVTGGQVRSRLQPDVAAVRPDGKVDITEVLSPRQDANRLAAKYAKALGDRMGSFRAIEVRREICTGTRIC